MMVVAVPHVSRGRIIHFAVALLLVSITLLIVDYETPSIRRKRQGLV
jgi:hypothetical protein